MKIKFLSVFILVFLFACNNKQKPSELTVVKKVDSQLIKEKDIAKLKYTEYLLDDRTEQAVVTWAEYTQLNNVIGKIKKGDLSFFKDNENAIVDLLKNIKQTIPLEVNTTSILARLTAVETKFLKLESLVNLSTTSKSELLERTNELLVAFSNLNLQMNKKLEGDNIIIEKP